MVATWPGGNSPPSITLHNTCYRTLRMIGPVSPKKMPGAKTEAPCTSHLVLFYGPPLWSRSSYSRMRPCYRLVRRRQRTAVAVCRLHGEDVVKGVGSSRVTRSFRAAQDTSAG